MEVVYHQETQTNSPVLLGIIIDMSSSMRESWKTKNGEKLSRIAMVRDTLNRRVKNELLRNKELAHSVENIDVFCLGLGFVYPIHLEYGRAITEADLPITSGKIAVMVDLICDLLALNEIIPTKSKLEDFQKNLNQKWQQCVGQIFNQAVIADDVFGELSEYVQMNLYESAMQKYERSLLYTLSHSSAWFADILKDRIQDKERKISSTSEIAAKYYVDQVYQKANSDFMNNRSVYTELIKKALESFIIPYVSSTLQALVLGFTPEEIVNDLDEQRALSVASTIYSQLENEVKKHIQVVISLYQQKLRFEQHSISAKIDMKHVTELTGKFVKKLGWDMLKPLIEETIYTMFVTQFEQQARQSFSHWLRLSSSRELIRPLAQLNNLLPVIYEDYIYSAGVMFGGTPFRQALDRAAARFIDKKYKDHKKMLLVISDGEFPESAAVTTSANLLKRRGVTIISGLIHKKNLFQQFLGTSTKNLPDGARYMVDIASEVEPQKLISSENHLTKALIGGKLCYQLNHEVVLDELLKNIFESEKCVYDEESL